MFRLTVALAASLALPAIAAAAELPIAVPTALLGGRVAPANPLPPPDPGVDPGVADDRDAGEVDLSDPDFWGLVWPSAAAAMVAPDEIVFDCDEDLRPGSCGLWGDAAAAGAATLQTSTREAPPESTVGAARKLRPAIGTWMTSQTPRLTWTPTSGATHYNVQIYLGPKRVASAWTTRPQLEVPPRVIDQGRYYMWSVWPGFGARTNPTFGEPLGRSVFGVVLRPRVVFRATGTGVVGEVRPRIPGGTLTLDAPSALRRRVPKRIAIGSNSRFRLRVSVADATRLRVRLIDPGPEPPTGLVRRSATP